MVGAHGRLVFRYLKYLSDARDSILTKNEFGFAPNDAGPIHLGLRLNTPRSGGAYNNLVYPKGGYVLHMVRMMMWSAQGGDQAFIRMMQDFVKTHLHKNASAESFQAVVEKHMTQGMNLTGNGKMDWFFQQWVYGNDAPKYDFSYEVTPTADGKFLLKGSLKQSEVSDSFRMPVPVYLELDGGRLAKLGDVVMAGNTTVSNISVPLAQKPKRVLINAYHDVLSRK